MTLDDGSDLVGTAQHPIWSESRCAWTPLGELLPGEHLRGRSGPLAVLSVVPLPGVADVYNLEIHGQHVYAITPAGVLVHNATGCRVTAYRAQGRPLVSVDGAGNVSIARPAGRQRQGVAVHVGFDEGRARMLMTERGRKEIVQFDVDEAFLERLRKTAQPERLPPGVARDRTLPWRVDIDWPDQYALPPSMLDDLLSAIVQGTGRVTRFGV